MSLFSSAMSKLFGTHSEREVKSITPLVDKIEAMADTYRQMSEAELKSQTGILKQRLAQGETLDDILPEAFAAVREAADRVLGMRPYRVQLIGGIILHQGRIAEMKTGEGKTLVEVLPAYLNALTGNGVHIVTVNDYLAKRDSEWMGKVFRYMGLKVGLIVHGLTNDQRREAYAAEVEKGNFMGMRRVSFLQEDGLPSSAVPQQVPPSSCLPVVSLLVSLPRGAAGQRPVLCLQPLLHRRAAVPLPAGAGHPAAAPGQLDRHRLRLRAAQVGGGGHQGDLRHPGPGDRS